MQTVKTQKLLQDKWWRPPTLTHGEKKLLASAILDMDSWGYASSKVQTATVIKLFVESCRRMNAFKDGIPDTVSEME